MSRTVDVVLGIVMERRGQGGASQFDHELLITQRPSDTVYGGYWELPGGKVEPGETPQAALRRELLEEVGIDVQPTLALTPIIHTYPHAQVRLMPFFCLRKQGQCRNLAVQQHRWIRPEAVGDYQFPEANETILQEMLARWKEAAACSPV